MPEPLATAEFEFSLAELADVLWRGARRSRTFRRQQLGVTLVMGVVAGAMACGAIVLTREHPDPTAVAVTGVLVAASMMVVRTLRLPGLYRRSVRRLVTERQGPGPWRCVVELRPEEMLVRQMNADLHFPWADVTSLRDVDGDFEMLARRGVLVVRARAFATAAERERFVSEARRLASNAS